MLQSFDLIVIESPICKWNIFLANLLSAREEI
jgi:hypothetical protein